MLHCFKSLYCRVVLACSSDGSSHLWPILCGTDATDHLDSGICIQEGEDIAQTQVCAWFCTLMLQSQLLYPIICRIAIKRENAVSKEIIAEFNQSSAKKLTKAERDER